VERRAVDEDRSIVDDPRAGDLLTVGHHSGEPWTRLDGQPGSVGGALADEVMC
jgi:hypothetical protein